MRYTYVKTNIKTKGKIGTRSYGNQTSRYAMELAAEKLDGCAAGEKCDKEFSMLIPNLDTTPHWQRGMFTILTQPLVDSFTCSFEGKLITVEYKLVISMKHDAWNSFGDGETMELPV